MLETTPMMDFQAYCRAHRGLRFKIARELGLNKAAVYQWRHVPADKVLKVERLTGISRHDLRPDLYPREERRA